jgi:hypothetical protein
MAQRYIKKQKISIVAPTVSKSVYPFISDKKISSGLNTNNQYFFLGRLIRPVNQNSSIDANLCFQCIVNNFSDANLNTKLNLKYEIQLWGGERVVDNLVGTFSLDPGFNDLRIETIHIDNTYDNIKMFVTIYGINEKKVTNPNIISLIYLEKAEG